MSIRIQTGTHRLHVHKYVNRIFLICYGSYAHSLLEELSLQVHKQTKVPPRSSLEVTSGQGGSAASRQGMLLRGKSASRVTGFTHEWPASPRMDGYSRHQAQMSGAGEGVGNQKLQSQPRKAVRAQQGP